MGLLTNGVLSLPRLYILSEFHLKAVKHAQSLFDCVLHTSPEAANWCKDAAAILVKNHTITAEDLQAAPQLRVIGKQGVGLDLIEMKACEAHGVKVFNTPGVNAKAVAEMALCLALSVSRDVPNIIIRQKVYGETVRKETITGQLIMGKILGIIGMGNIGRETARIFQDGLRTPIITYDPHFPEESGPSWAKIAHRRFHGLEQLLKESDIVSVHVPLTPSTRGLISYDRMKLMKASAILINTARGGIVDEGDLTRALEEGLIAGAGFDCHEEEPPTKDRYERLWACPGFVGTPHIAAATEATQVATTNGATDQVYANLKNEALSVKA
ncbi:hypothetical protein NCS52_01484800 [Fusarium sp. LHS14.1]|nr:hypothetical protein NCS52_01484800 [Fusarium sp. LHS14.1]